MNSFTIAVDSNCDLPQEFIKEHGIEIIPMPFELDGTPHNGGYWQQISGKDFYDSLRNGSVGKTSQINPDNFAKYYSEYIHAGKDVLFLLLSSGLSATYNSSVIALRETKKKHPNCNVYTIDSLDAASGLGLLVMLAVQKRAEGLSVSETAAWLEHKKNYLLGFFTVDDLMYLHRGGRLSKLSAIAGSMFGVKPVLTFLPDGTLALKEKVRGRKGAMELMIAQMKKGINSDAALETVMISHTDCEEDAKEFAEMVKASVKVKNVVVTLMGPVIGSHLGPNSLTLVFEGDMTRQEYEDKYYK